MTSKCYSIRFKSPLIQPGGDEKLYGDLRRYFTSIAPLEKLFIHYHEGYGVVYYSTREACTDVLSAIQPDNPYSVVFDKNHDISKSIYTRQKPVAAECNRVCFDANGNTLKVLEDPNTSEKYIALKEANKGGFILYDTQQAAQKQTANDLKEFLIAQAELYMKIRYLQYNVKTDVEINVELKPKPTENSEVLKNISSSENLSDMNGSSSAKKIVNLVSPSYSRSMQATPNKENQPPSSTPNSTSASTETTPSSSNPVKTLKKTPRQLIETLRLASRRNSNASTISTPSFACKPQIKFEKQLKLDKYPPGTAFVPENNERALMQVLHVLSEKTFIAYVFSTKAKEFDDLIGSAKIDTTILTPGVGDYVMVKCEGEKLSRAFVLELKNEKCKVALLDYATVMEVDTVYEAPPELAKEKFDEFTYLCEAPSIYIKSLTVDDTKTIISKQNSVFLDTDLNVQIKYSRWIPEEFRHYGTTQLKESQFSVKKSEQTIYKSLPLAEIPIADNDLLILAGFENGLLYLRSKDMHDQLKRINDTSNQAERLEKPVQIGQYVRIHKNKLRNEEMRRAVVKNISNNGVLVQYIDYFKSVELVSPNDIYNLTKTTALGPTLIKRRLRNFEDKEYSEKAIAKMQEFIKKKFSICYIQDDIINLKSLENGKKTLSDVLLELDQPAVHFKADIVTQAYELEQLFKMIVLHVEDDCFYFGDSNISNSVISVLESGNKLEHEPCLNDMVEGQMVCALYEDGWYRGEVKKIEEDKVEIYFIDFGNTNFVKKEYIRAFPEDLLECPVCAYKAVFVPPSTNKPNISEGYIVKLKKIEGDTFHLELVGYFNVQEE